MCDTEFMEKYCNGVPIYNKLKTIRNDYDLVLLDGPHTTYDVLKEVMFFGERLNNNGMMILDDWPTYKSPMIVDIAKMLDIKPLHIGENKLVLKNMINIIDNFLPKKEFDDLKNTMESAYFPWYFNPFITDASELSDIDLYQFTQDFLLVVRVYNLKDIEC